MKRSEVNAYIRYNMALMEKHRFMLPDWAFFKPEDWKAVAGSSLEIFENGIGWDITDFGWGDFEKIGLSLITLRNGNIAKPGGKVYCEKIMVVRDGQVTPEHYHVLKTEDIINRGGGLLCMKLWNATEDSKLDSTDVHVQVDGMSKVFKAGETIKLKPGQSVCYTPYLYHTFWAEGGDALVGEVSSVNDDKTDNYFLIPKGRFSNIEEDEPIEHYLCNEYPF